MLHVFFPGQHDFLHHILSFDRISANPENVDKVREWLVPNNAKELPSFLRLGSYYHWFIPNFSHIAKGLHQLIDPTDVKNSKGKKKEMPIFSQIGKDKNPFVWSSEHQTAFDTLKPSLTTTPVLGYLDITKEFILETNASVKSLGAVLSQEDNTGKVWEIGYAGRTLRPSIHV